MTAAPAAATAAATRHRPRRDERAVALHAEDRQLAADLLARAARARRDAVDARHVPLEVLAAGLTAIFVDRHLFAASLHVALHELLGVLLEDVVDLVEELVDVFLDLLALLGNLGIGGGAIPTTL